MEGYVPGEQTLAPRTIKLNTNENPYPPSPRVSKALREFDGERLRLYPNPVGQKLKERIAELHGCTPEQVFVGNGSDEVLALCTRAFVENDGTIGYFDPSYSLYPVLTDIRDAAKRPVSLGDAFDWRMADDYDVSLFFLTNPNAPTGMLFPREEVEAFCRRSAGVVLIDEAYVDFSSAHCMDLALACDNVLVARTLSKSFSLAGLRLGYCVGNARLIEAMMKIKDSYNLDMVTQILALAALNDVEHMQANVERVKTTRERLTAALVELGFESCPSETNFIWTRPPEGVAAQELFEQLHEDGILVRYFRGERTGGYIRITIGTDEQVDRLIGWLRGRLA